MGTDADAPPGTARGRGEPRRDQSREVARITAFSDGVFAIAITLLALPLALPRGDGVEVWAELQRLGPSFRSFCISFVVIGAYWIGHRGIFLLVERSDRRLLWLNLLLLFFIVLLPFTTSL
ncbi:MAG TPA: TMEM175 family protein, partial [Thermoleophilia bacterium]|nr:TMEM175 family protein [Thermoleophilia bacterium]